MEEAFEKYSKNVQKEFKQIFDDAKQVTPAEGVKDPYYLAKIASHNGTAVEELKPEDYYRIIKARVPSFNSTIYEASITIPQLVEFFKTNKWSLSTDNLILEAKTLVDKFDFNGDGRLNFREFIIALIFKTEDLVRAKICTKCLEGIAEEIIEPIFSFIDCEKRNMISAEEIWNNLKYLIRRDEHTYNIFTCKISNELYRTSSINDFVLKAHKTTLGYLTRNEFRSGLFLAFWDRYVGEISLKEEEEKIRKNERWGNSGKDDNICGNIHKHIQVIKKEISEAKKSKM
jgi:Ca2+-binding EF-hand superfamily protein